MSCQPSASQERCRRILHSLWALLGQLKVLALPVDFAPESRARALSYRKKDVSSRLSQAGKKKTLAEDISTSMMSYALVMDSYCQPRRWTPLSLIDDSIQNDKQQ